VIKKVSILAPAVSIWLILFFVLSLLFLPKLILEYYPPFTDFKLNEIRYDRQGALYFQPSFNKVWCAVQEKEISWSAKTNGVSERVSITFPKAAKGGANRAPGLQLASEWKVDIFTKPDAIEQSGHITHICLLFFKVETIIGPFPIPVWSD